MLKRKPFKAWTPKPATQTTYTPRPRAVAVSDGKARMVVPVPKGVYLRDKEYRRWVASLPCCHCGMEGRSQAAHADQGKGGCIKSSDDTCFPLCADSPGRQGCHALIGASGTFTQAQRRELEVTYQERTKALWNAKQTGAA